MAYKLKSDVRQDRQDRLSAMKDAATISMQLQKLGVEKKQADTEAVMAPYRNMAAIKAAYDAGLIPADMAQSAVGNIMGVSGIQSTAPSVMPSTQPMAPAQAQQNFISVGGRVYPNTQMPRFTSQGGQVQPIAPWQQGGIGVPTLPGMDYKQMREAQNEAVKQQIQAEAKSKEALNAATLKSVGEAIAKAPDFVGELQLFDKALDDVITNQPEALKGDLTGELNRWGLKISRPFRQDKFSNLTAFQAQTETAARSMAKLAGEDRLSNQDATAFLKGVMNFDKNALSVNLKIANEIFKKYERKLLSIGIDPGQDQVYNSMGYMIDKIENVSEQLHSQHTSGDPKADIKLWLKNKRIGGE